MLRADPPSSRDGEATRYRQALRAKTPAEVERAPVLVEDADLAIVDSEKSLLLPPPRSVGGTFAADDPWDGAPVADVGVRDPAVAGQGPARAPMLRDLLDRSAPNSKPRTV